MQRMEMTEEEDDMVLGLQQLQVVNPNAYCIIFDSCTACIPCPEGIHHSYRNYWTWTEKYNASAFFPFYDSIFTAMCKHAADVGVPEGMCPIVAACIANVNTKEWQGYTWEVVYGGMNLEMQKQLESKYNLIGVIHI